MACGRSIAANSALHGVGFSAGGMVSIQGGLAGGGRAGNSQACHKWSWLSLLWPLVVRWLLQHAAGAAAVGWCCCCGVLKVLLLLNAGAGACCLAD